jgi:hypothetical protein
MYKIIGLRVFMFYFTPPKCACLKFLSVSTQTLWGFLFRWCKEAYSEWEMRVQDGCETVLSSCSWWRVIFASYAHTWPPFHLIHLSSPPMVYIHLNHTAKGHATTSNNTSRLRETNSLYGNNWVGFAWKRRQNTVPEMLCPKYETGCWILSIAVIVILLYHCHTPIELV